MVSILKTGTQTKFSHHLYKRPHFPGEFSVTSGPYLLVIYRPATQTASPSADPAASSWNSGSLCGHGYYCKALKKHIHTVSESGLFLNLRSETILTIFPVQSIRILKLVREYSWKVVFSETLYHWCWHNWVHFVTKLKLWIWTGIYQIQCML